MCPRGEMIIFVGDIDGTPHNTPHFFLRKPPPTSGSSMFWTNRFSDFLKKCIPMLGIFRSSKVKQKQVKYVQ